MDIFSIYLCIIKTNLNLILPPKLTKLSLGLLKLGQLEWHDIVHTPFTLVNLLLQYSSHFKLYSSCLVSWGCRIHQLLFCRWVRPPPKNKCPGYDAKQSDTEVPVMLALWRMQNTPLLPLFPGLL